MNNLKKLILLNVILFLTSCGSIKEGFSSQKKNNNDEFLVEKKSPLIMPPDYNELPIPQTNEVKIISEESEIKELITNQDETNISSETNKNVDKNFEEILLEKIKKN